MELNAGGAKFDQFLARIADASGQQGVLCMQSKHTCALEDDVLSLGQIRKEYDKIVHASRDGGARH